MRPLRSAAILMVALGVSGCGAPAAAPTSTPPTSTTPKLVHWDLGSICLYSTSQTLLRVDKRDVGLTVDQPCPWVRVPKP